MTDLSALAAEIANLPEVSSAKVWDGRRVYVNITGRNTSKAGDRNAKVYFDGKLERWVIDGLKGTFSPEFNYNIRKFAETRCRSAFWTE